MNIESLKQKDKVSYIFQMPRDDYDRMKAVQEYLGFRTRSALMVALIREAFDCITPIKEKGLYDETYHG